MIKYTLDLDDNVSGKLARLGSRADELRELVLKRLGGKAVSIAQKDYLTGQKLNIRSGNLRSAMNYRLRADKSVYIGNSMVYSAIHEFGGTIVPKRGQYLRFFNQEGQEIFVKQVVMPKRSYTRPAIDQLFNSGLAKRESEAAFKTYLRRYIE